jgi:asparagine synthase (glutamine-hydrolysing)
MCGIAGILSLNQEKPCLPLQLFSMIAAMRHRGPDEQGIFIDDSIGLAHARLSIIDLSHGSQPLSNEDQSIWVVFNGEIYNYLELKKELENKGHVFRTNTDTEVIVHLYEEKGIQSISEFNGQFAFGLWDTKKQMLFLVRDRIGVRPLHYCVHDKKLLFSSEIKSLFAADTTLPRRIDPVTMDQVFTFWAPLPGRTMFKGIKEVQAGHYLTINSSGDISDNCYWTVPFVPREQWSGKSLEELSRSAAELLEDSVCFRLRADVPVATYLSGGLDSSITSALAVKNLNRKVHTFGIRFGNERFDEGEYQRLMSRYLGTEHHEIIATSQNIGDTFGEVIWHCEKPILRTAPVPLFLLSKMVRESDIKVVLTGEGSDEFWGGYDIFKEARLRRFWAGEPKSVWRPDLFAHLYPDIFKDQMQKRTLRLFFGRDLDNANDVLFSHALRWANSARTKQFFSPELQLAIGKYDGMQDLRSFLPDHFIKLDPLTRSQYLESTLFLTQYLLSSQGDRVAMAHSVEIRLPFMDPRVMAFAGHFPLTGVFSDLTRNLF